jgi:hypothetical protein
MKSITSLASCEYNLANRQLPPNRGITKRSTEAAGHAGFDIMAYWRRLGYRCRYAV